MSSVNPDLSQLNVINSKITPLHPFIDLLGTMPETSKLTLEKAINLNFPKEYKLQVNALKPHAFST